jgi:putative phosphoesterase
VRPSANVHLVGVISDTHGLLRPEALHALAGAELIIHAGDLGSMRVLEALQHIAPVFAVRGNIDKGMLAKLPATRVVEVGRWFIYVLHDAAQLDLDPAAAGFGAVVSGHSHRPAADQRGGVLFLNPGSAGPRLFDLPVSVARLHVRQDRLETELIELPV